MKFTELRFTPRQLRVKGRMKKQDIEDLRELIEFLKQHGVAEFDVDRGDLKIRLKFNPQEGTPAGLSDLAKLLRSAPTGLTQAAAAAAIWSGYRPTRRSLSTPMPDCTW